MVVNEVVDTRTPSPPLGYSKACTHSMQQQIHIVAEFHVHKINPKRIAYRTGIDITLVEDLIAGESQEKLFKRLLAHYRTRRRDQRLKKSLRQKGIAQATLQDDIEREYQASLEPVEQLRLS